MSDSLFDDLQALLLARYPGDYPGLVQRINATQSHLSGVERARTRGLSRLSQALCYLYSEREDKQPGTADLVVLIRQVVRAYARPLLLPEILWRTLYNQARSASLYVTPQANNVVEVRAKAWQPAWLARAEEVNIDELAYRRSSTSAPGDGLVAALTGGAHTTYLSVGQKRAVDATLFATPGSTTLVTLPTGSGKSLCTVLPAWLASRGGMQRGGTTLVVVPTVSLALDQQRSAQKYFQNAVDQSFMPQCLIGDTPPETRALIYQGLENGTLPMLFTSPEGILNNRTVYEKALQAAQKGFLKWLVIDEAHIVADWGNVFRTEFQLLATFRQQLLNFSKGQLRTLLLSATVSYTCQELLQKLFSESDNLTTVLANQVRPEVAYWFNVAPDEEQRQQRVLEALYHLPRPAILYTTTPRPQALEWWQLLRDYHHFQRLAVYSGHTKELERRSIMRDWEQDELDLIVATSAFGLGVDKEDVRTVIHATVPENVDRFYQEVGRGGRDGCQAISFVCTVPGDNNLAWKLTTGSHVTTEKAWPRWQAMWAKGRFYREQPDERLLDLEATPAYNREIEPGTKHRNWNEHIALLLQRLGVIFIVHIVPPELPEEPVTNEIRPQPMLRRRLLVKTLDYTLAYDEAAFRERFEAFRHEERQKIIQTLGQMRSLIKDHGAASPPADCIAYTFASLYPATAVACGGCPACRAQKRAPYASPIVVDAEWTGKVETQVSIEPRLAQRLGPRQSLNAIWDDFQNLYEIGPSLLQNLAHFGFQQFVLGDQLANDPAWLQETIAKLASSVRPGRPQRLIPADWLTERYTAWPLYPLPTVVFYPAEERKGDELYLCLKREMPSCPIIHVIRRSLLLPSLGGRFIDKVDGIQIALPDLNSQLNEWRMTLSH